MQSGYFATAWADIKNSKGWFGKLFLLALIALIPVFGVIVVCGYIWGWAREIAWNIKAPLPAKIFGNEDGKLYTRGWAIVVVIFVFLLIVTFGSAVSAALFVHMGSFGDFMNHLVVLLLQLAVVVFAPIAAIRAALYERISAGLQFNKIWKMFRHDTNGIMRITGMAVLLSVIAGIVIAILIAIISAVCITVFVAMFGPVILDIFNGFTYGHGYVYGHGYGNSSMAMQYLGLLGPMTVMAVIVGVIIGFVYIVVAVLLGLLIARAIGYWTRNFNVAAWGNQKEPMPFEREETAQNAAQAAPVFPQWGDPQQQTTVRQPQASQVPPQAYQSQPPITGDNFSAYQPARQGAPVQTGQPVRQMYPAGVQPVRQAVAPMQTGAPVYQPVPSSQWFETQPVQSMQQVQTGQPMQPMQPTQQPEAWAMPSAPACQPQVAKPFADPFAAPAGDATSSGMPSSETSSSGEVLPSDEASDPETDSADQEQ